MAPGGRNDERDAPVTADEREYCQRLRSAQQKQFDRRDKKNVKLRPSSGDSRQSA